MDDNTSIAEPFDMDEEITEEERIKNVFNDLRHDFENAKDAKTEIDELMNEWNDLYYGIRRNKDGDIIKNKTNKSSITMKEVAKQIEWSKPNITEPFTSTRHPINLSDTKNASRARHLEKWANHQFTEVFDREEFYDQAVDVLLREGTVWVQTSWERKVENERIVIPSISMDELMMNEQEPDEINQNSNGTFSVEYNNEVTSFNDPHSEVCRNEHCFPDPSARTERDLRFFCIIKLMTPSELRSIGSIPEEKLEALISKVNSEDREDTAAGIHRDADAKMYGRSDHYEPNDITRKQIRIVEYWGFYDLNDDGIAEPIRGYFAEKYNDNLLVEENPMPFKNIPFDRSVYSARPFSLWGNAMAFFLGDNQRAKTGIVRGIFDNMSLANNGQKFMQRGAVDYVNFKRLNNGERYIIVNKPDSIKDGSYNQIPTSVFSTLQMFTKESEDLAGVSSGGPALSNEHVGKDGQQAQLTMSQQRMAAMVRNLSNLLRKMISKWLTMAEVFVTDQQIQEMFTKREQVDMNVFAHCQNAKVNVRVGTEVNRNMKLQQYNMLMQQANALEGELPPGTMKEMVAEMLDLFDMHEKATELRLYEKKPSQEEQAMMQMQMKEKQLELQKLETEIGVMTRDVEARFMNAQARMMEANANYGYKGAQTEEKYAKAKAHQMDTAVKPVQIENELRKTNNEQNKDKTKE